MPIPASCAIRIEVQRADALKFSADVLALKYAQDLHGADAAVYQHLSDLGHRPPLPRVNNFELISTQGLLGAENVLFLGVLPLTYFGYEQIREFGRKVLEILADQAIEVEHLALTIHGPGYGLDEEEAFESELAGMLEALEAGKCPASLSRISFVERNPGRALRLEEHLKGLFPGNIITPNEGRRSRGLGEPPSEALRTAGLTSADKPSVFVAMPFVDSMDDVFHYGIQGAVKAAGFLCERADLTSFVGDVMEWVKKRISNATFVVADLTTANPNVYLEVGYAWGCGRPTILIVRDSTDLKFDVKGQRCLVYKSIKHLEEILGKELSELTSGSSDAWSRRVEE
jgi:hypothetical protein